MDSILKTPVSSAQAIPTTTISRTPLPTSTDYDPFVLGWRSQLNSRGNVDIIWTCLCTIFLCTWTVFCLNVLPRHERKANIIFRRFRWMILSIAGPEFVSGFAAGQYENTYNSVAAFGKLGYSWTMRHAFFADMGGFHLHPRDNTPFPVNNKHIFWPIEDHYMQFPVIESHDIWNKSKADSLLKWLLCFQISWVLLNVAARAIQHLSITTMELGTVSVVALSIAILVIWLHKPLDILCATSDIVQKPYVTTPLDFVDNMGPSWNANVLAFVNIRAGPRDRPLPRFTNDRFPHIRGIRYGLLVFVTLFGVGIHLFGWNYRFPTHGEQIVWRVASLQMFSTSTMFWFAELAAGWKRDNVTELWYCMIFSCSKLPDLKERRRMRPKSPINPRRFSTSLGTWSQLYDVDFGHVYKDFHYC